MDGPTPFDVPPTGYGSDLWMTVQDIFHITGRGTVLTGQLQGNGQLRAGDTVLCDGMSWQVGAIEQFRAISPVAVPGMNIGILLRKGPTADVLRGRTVHFEPANKPGPDIGLRSLAPKKRRWRS